MSEGKGYRWETHRGTVGRNAGVPLRGTVVKAKGYRLGLQEGRKGPPMQKHGYMLVGRFLAERRRAVKFMEPIQTTMGPGLVVGAMTSGQVVAAVPMVKRVPALDPEKPSVEKKFCPHRIFSWCERHQIWHTGVSSCPMCAADREAGCEQ